MHRLSWSLRSKFETKRMPNKKMLIAPILAVALVLSLTAAVSYLPLSPQATPQVAPKNQLSTASTPAPTSQPGSMSYMNSSGASRTQIPVPAPTLGASPTQPPVPAPTAAPASASITQTVYFLPVLFVTVAVVLGVVAVQVLFREKDLRKELNSEGE